MCVFWGAPVWLQRLMVRMPFGAGTRIPEWGAVRGFLRTGTIIVARDIAHAKMQERDMMHTG